MITRDDVLAAVREAHVSQNPDDIRDEVNLSEQGIDSLGIFNILLLLEETHGIKIPDEDITHLLSVRDMVNYLNRNSA